MITQFLLFALVVFTLVIVILLLWYRVYDSEKLYKELDCKFSKVLDHASVSNISRTEAPLEDILKAIDSSQYEFQSSVIKEDINDIILTGGTIAEIKGYIDTL